MKPKCKCDNCGNPNVRLIWAGFCGMEWTGACGYCRAIIFATKEEIVFDE